MKNLLRIISLAALLTPTAFSQNDPIYDDLYVQLYSARLERQKARLKQQDAELSLATKDFSRMQKLLDSKAISKAEYDIAQRSFLAVQASILEVKAGLKEAEVLLRIAKDRISAGLDMPICAQLQ